MAVGNRDERDHPTPHAAHPLTGRRYFGEAPAPVVLPDGRIDNDEPEASSDPAPRHGRRYLSVVGRNVLVISTVEHADDVLRTHVGEADAIKVVVPVVKQGVLAWLANDQGAFGRAERVAERTAEQLSGETVDAVAGEADVDLAIRDALATFPADEIVVAVRPEEKEGFVESIATDSAPQHRLEGVPVRFVVIGG
jgi:hypothetical protein